MKSFIFLIVYALGSAAASDSEIISFLRYSEGQGYFLAPDANDILKINEFDTDRRYNAENETYFRLYTRNNPTSYQEILLGDLSALLNSNYDKNKKLKMLIHGWNNHGDSGVCTRPRDAFLQADDVNVICIDWSKGGTALLYPTAVANALKAGSVIGKFLDWLVSLGSGVNNVHIIGHSLGGHVAGIGARNVKSGKVAYVTGLDPAMPLWGSSSQRIRPSDGLYVEIIHTNGGFLGLDEPVGHNDFYANGGKIQPGCSVIDMNCSHGRSVMLFTYSIDNQNFMASQCKDHGEISNGNCSGISKLHMGGLNPKEAQGIFSLKTSANPPYYID